MKKPWIYGLGLLTLFFLMTPSTNAEPISKHPRVAELEDKLTKDASTYLKGRFPDRPFLVTVSADPLRRATQKNPAAEENLPFLDFQHEEIQDEWDDPQISISYLMLRLKKVSVQISVPESISDDEAEEVKASVFQILHLTPARDTIEVVRKKWTAGPQNLSYAVLTGSALLIILLGFYFIGSRSATRFASALRELKISAQAQSGGASPALSLSATPASTRSTARDSSDSHGLAFSDPLKIRERVEDLIQVLQKQASFPTLNDLIRLDSLGQQNPQALGSILAELPLGIQKKIFSVTGDLPHWLEAFDQPASLTGDTLNLVEHLSRTPRDSSEAEFQEMLILVWRLGPKMQNLLQKIKSDEALTLLSTLPKVVSIKLARQILPGSWGALLNPEFRAKTLGPSQVRELKEKALEIKPLSDYEKLKTYRSDHELVEYLKLADLSEEREIYGAAAPSSLIHQLRTPFYPIFDQTQEFLQAFVTQASPEDWALALVNLSASERKKIDPAFSEKQKYLFLERIKAYENQTPDPTRVGEMRERLGQLFHEYCLKKSAEGKAKDDSQKTAQADPSVETNKGERRAA
ncbi:MAG: hypothetical protein ACO3A2_10785 [Bdellovibrionia bacterium]